MKRQTILAPARPHILMPESMLPRVTLKKLWEFFELHRYGILDYQKELLDMKNCITERLRGHSKLVRQLNRFIETYRKESEVRYRKIQLLITRNIEATKRVATSGQPVPLTAIHLNIAHYIYDYTHNEYRHITNVIAKLETIEMTPKRTFSFFKQKNNIHEKEENH